MKRDYPIVIAGAGGGKGGAPKAASEAPNSLRSKQVAHIIDLLGEGEWEGLVDGPGGIFFNDVALFSPTTPTADVVSFTDATSDDGTWTVPGTWNFKGVTVEFRNGTQSQPAIRMASSSSSVMSVNTAVTNSTPITATITNPNVDVAIVNLQVNALYQQDTTSGGITGYSVDIEIQARQGTGAFVSVKKDRIEGKCMSPYVRAYSVDLSLVGSGAPWDIKVIRTSADDVDSSKHSEIVFLGMDIMSRDKFRYPNSVLCSVGIDASQLTSIPTRAYNVKMSRIRVPSNYNPTTRAYTGVWDGSFQIAWSDNPAWCLYDLITNSRYGLGEYIDDTLSDKWTLYTIGQYCDEMVDDGFGGTEPRFTMNAFFQASEEAITMLQNMASVFRGILYYLNELMTAVQDAPSDSVYQFNQTNVVDGIFSYAGASGSTRHTIVMVVWNNPEINYKQDIEVVEDVAGLQRFGYRPVTVQALGCTSRGQAHRLGRWTLYVEQYEADIVSFSTALEGTGVQPGNIIDVYDPVRANTRLGGRVLDVTGQTVLIDKAVTLPVGTHTMSFIANDGTLATRSFTVTAGSYSSILLDGTGSVPSAASVFGIQTADVLSQQFRIISITESDRHKYDITAVSHNSGKYAYIEDNVVLETRPTRYDTTPLLAPANFVYTEALYLLADGSIANRLVVGWDQNPRAVKYVVSIKVGSGNWSPEQFVDTHQYTLNSVVTGWPYSFRVSAISLNDVRGAQAEVTYTILGEKFPPPPFDVLTASVGADGTRVIGYGYTVTAQPLDYAGAELRWGATADWNSMTPIGDGFYTYSPVETGQIPSGTHYVAAKARDKTQVLSTPVYLNAALGEDPSDVISGIGAKDLTPPPTPTGFSVSAAITHIIVTTDVASYTQGHGPGRTCLYGKVYTSGALPTFSAATKIMEFTGPVGAFPSDIGTTWRLWVTWESVDGVQSATPAGGTNGLGASTGTIGTANLGNQIVTAGKLADGAVLLSKFDSTLTPVQIVTTLPTTGLKEGLTVYLTTDDKIYRYTGTAWIKAVDGADITANTILANSIAAGAITAVKMAANAIAVGTAAIQNGAIINAMMGTAAIDTANIVNLAVVTAKMADANVTNAKIGNYIASNNFNGTIDGTGTITANGTTGWAIDKAGNAVFNNIFVRGNVQATSINGSIVDTANVNPGAVSGAYSASSSTSTVSVSITVPASSGSVWVLAIGGTDIFTGKPATVTITGFSTAAGVVSTSGTAMTIAQSPAAGTYTVSVARNNGGSGWDANFQLQAVVFKR